MSYRALLAQYFFYVRTQIYLKIQGQRYNFLIKNHELKIKRGVREKVSKFDFSVN